MRLRALGWRLLTLIGLICFGGAAPGPAADDPLPSWNEGEAKRALLDFVACATDENCPNFIPVAERIATFDNDGTLWCEQPVYFQAEFIRDRIVGLAKDHPEWKTEQPFKAILENDRKALADVGELGLVKLVAATHSGMTTDDFDKLVKHWFATARHPRFKRPYNELVYQPMLEVLAYLRANGFKTFIVSGGGQEFMRGYATVAYGIPPDQIVGSGGQLKYELNEAGEPIIMRLPEIDFIDDGPGKVVGIQRFIGQRPVLAFGNSDGDYEMLRWTTADTGKGYPRLGLIVHHTDAEREYAYDHPSTIGQLKRALDEAKQRDWVVVSMKDDWKAIFPPAQADRKATLMGDWSLVKLGDKAVAADGRPTLRVSVEGNVVGSAGVNHFSGRLATGKTLFGPLAMTLRGGPPETMALENAYTKALKDATRFAIKDDQLTLFAGDEPRLVFQRRNEQPK